MRPSVTTDSEIRRHVERELEWDPRVTPTSIRVTVRGGSITLTGDVSTYAEKEAAVEAANRLYGLVAVADELRVKLATGHRRADSDIARAVGNVIRWNVNIPEGCVTATCRGGVVRLRGTVEFPYQRIEAERAVRYVVGVTGLRNEIRVEQVSATRVAQQIVEALRHEADLDAQKIRVEVRGDTVELYGHVHSLQEANLVRRAAQSAPGVNEVKGHLAVES